MPRLFVAFEVPEAVRNAVLLAAGRLRRVDADVRWAAPDHLHVTLRFLGEVPEASVPGVEAMLRQACRDGCPFEVAVAGLGTFGGRTPRVVWAGVRGTDDESQGALHRVQRGVDEGALGLGFPSDRGIFTAHLTLGRVKGPRRAAALREEVAALQDQAFGAFRVSELVLFQSKLGRDGSVYTPLLRAGLGIDLSHPPDAWIGGI